MNEIKKMLIVLGVVLALAIVAGVVAYRTYADNKKIYDDFVAKFNGSEPTLFYIGRPTCGYCNLLNISLDEMEVRYNFHAYYINTDEINSRVLMKILKHFNLTSVGTPYLAVASNGKISGVQNGYIDYDQFFKFLQKYEVIDDDATLPLNYIGLNDYKTKLSENKLNVIVVGQSLCQYCAAAKVVLNKIADQTELEINYVNITYLTDSEKQEFRESLDCFKQSYGTPVILITKGGKMVAKYEGYAPYEQYLQFFKQNGVL